jgi:DNA-binding HxlR family transcriptional regulator
MGHVPNTKTVITQVSIYSILRIEFCSTKENNSSQSDVKMEKYVENRKKKTNKARYDKNVIRELLLEGPKSTRQIREKLPISTSVLKSRLDEMMKIREIEFFPDPSDKRIIKYKLSNQKEAESELRKHEMISFMGDAFVQTKWPEKWIEEAFRENINKIYQEMFSLREKVTMSKEEEFFYEVAKEEAIKDRASEINLSVFHKGLAPFQFTQNEEMVKVTLQFMIRFFADFIQARKDEDMPIMMVLSYLPNVSRAHMKLDEALKETVESEAFVSWAKLFKNVDIESVSGNTEKELQKEYWQKYVKTHLSLFKHSINKR